MLAIVGPSGSGKSTVADLVVRLLDPDSGVVRLDGRDLRTLRLEDLRRNIAVVDQDPCILHASIADNIRYARPDATDEEVSRRRAGRRSRRFVNRLPDGYATVVGERGAALSAGERQRIAWRARFSSIRASGSGRTHGGARSGNRTRSVSGLESSMAGRTTIVITHRLEVASRADRVLVLETVRAGAPGRCPRTCSPGAWPRGTLVRWEDRTGRGVRVAVIDSGIHAGHPHIGGHRRGRIRLDEELGADISDRIGHGTAVAAAIHEKAPHAKLYAVKVFDRTLSTTAERLVHAIYWAAARARASST